MKKEWKVAISGLLALCMTVQPGLSAIPAVQAKETGQVIIDASDYGATPQEPATVRKLSGTP